MDRNARTGRTTRPLAVADRPARADRRAVSPVGLGTSVLIVGAGYYLGAVLGIKFQFPAVGIATFWPPNAIVLAALLREPPRVWWVYLLVLLPIHLHVVAVFQQNVPFVVMLSQFTGNMLQAVVGALAVRAVEGGVPRFDSLRGVTTYVLLAGVGAIALATTVSSSLFLLTGWTTDYWLTWRHRMFANGFAVLTVAPLILVASNGELLGRQRPSGRRYAELAAVLVGLAAVGLLVFASETPRADIMPALLLAPLPFLFWAAVRLGTGGLCISLLGVLCMSWATVYGGRWPFPAASLYESVASLQAFLLAIAVPLMFLSALIEERHRVEREAQRQRDELAHAQRVSTLGALSASIAHELRQPLTAITANAEAWRVRQNAGDVPPAFTREILTDITSDALRADLVIQRLRALLSNEQAERVRLDLNTLVENVIGLLGPDFTQRHVIRVARNDTPLPILGDPIQLQQVLLNLILNAGEAIAAAGDGPALIAIDVDQPETGRFRLRVSDNGVGVVESADLERMFEHFVTNKPNGLGLGLTISRTIIDAHGGRIWATRNAMRGLTLHVELPALVEADVERPVVARHADSLAS